MPLGLAIIGIVAALLACSPPPGDHASGDSVPPAATSKQDERPPSSNDLARMKKRHAPWLPLEDDHLHDPANPALKLLQQPSEALSVLPRAVEGNQVDWVAALRDGFIQPRTNIHPETKVKVLDLDIVMSNTAGMPAVLFPHRAHTEWLDCTNCHDRIFKAKRDANHMNMLSVLQGKDCGQCHGAVSFPLTQCRRCHSVPRNGNAIGGDRRSPGR